jgi:hypothetical protein
MLSAALATGYRRLNSVIARQLDPSIFVAHNDAVRAVKFSRSARRHKIGKAHALAAMENAGAATLVPADEKHGERWVWTGPDDRGVELVIVGVEKPDCLLILHVQPASYKHQEPQ